MHRHRRVLRLAATAAIIALVWSGAPFTGTAWAEIAAPEPNQTVSAPSLSAEAVIDASAITSGTLRVSVTCRGLPAGPSAWQRRDGGAIAASAIRLVDATGREVVPSVDSSGITADLPAGDWTLAYDLSSDAPSGQASFRVTPAACLLLPAGATIRVVLSAPPGWITLANTPAVSQNMDELRLLTARFLLAPAAPPVIAAIGSGPVRTLIVAADAGVSLTDEQNTVLVRAYEAFTAAVPGSFGGDTCLFITGDGTVEDMTRDLLDTLWATCGTRASASDGPEIQRLIDEAVWPLLRDALLRACGFPGDPLLAQRICEQHRSSRDAERQTPLASAPLAALYFVAGAVGGPVELHRLVAAVSGDAGEGSGGDFIDRLAAAIAAVGPDQGPAASSLLLGLAGRAAGAVVQLPDLPDELLAVGDPDRDGDGLPDRLDSEPDTRGIAIQVAGRTVRLDVAPLSLGGRVMVPLRFLAEQLGLTVGWDDTSRTATVSNATAAALFPVDTHYYVQGGRTHYIDRPTTIVGGRTMVSLRFVAKALNVGIAWDDATRTVIVSPEQGYAEAPPQPVAGRVAYLTFDDGPEPGMTPQILDVLKECDARAMFFVLGTCAAKHGDLLRRIVAEGHAIGNHTYSHNTNSKSDGFVYRSPEAYLAELAACDRVVAAATGLHPRASRPPGGSYPHLTEGFRVLLRANGYLTYDWDVSAADSALPRPTTEQVLANIMAGARDGQRRRLVILMHDGGSQHQTTLAALPAVIEYLRACGYEFGVLSGAAAAPADR
ncbi:MAG: polysaccharide deacetylase family protein [Chloroflexota bacterium]